MTSDEEGGLTADPALRARRSPGRAVVYGVIGFAVVAIPTIWVATLDSTFAIPQPASAEGDDVVQAWRILFTMATAIAMVVVVLLAAAIVSGARRRRASQSKGSVPLELTYTAVPVLLVAAIFGVSLWLADQVDRGAGDEELVVEAEAFRWGWRFTYPDGTEVVGADADAEPTLVVPVDRPLTLTLRSSDVIHSFYVPAFVTKLDMIPGRENRLTVRPQQTGVYQGFCAEFCGIDHARMNFRVAVVDREAFDAWRTTGELREA